MVCTLEDGPWAALEKDSEVQELLFFSDATQHTMLRFMCDLAANVTAIITSKRDICPSRGRLSLGVLSWCQVLLL